MTPAAVTAQPLPLSTAAAAQAPQPPRLRTRRTLAWPLPAVLAWAAGWLVWWLLRSAGAATAVAFATGLLASGGLALRNPGAWRRCIAAAGFPLSALALGGAAAMPPWLWLLLLAPVLLAYPLRAWRDAPFFPTPAAALQGLDSTIGTPPRRVLDAGCGLGHGLAALHRLWPTAELHGIEWSPALAWLTALRCRLQRWPATASRGDMWAASWAGFDVVYAFQRPESMARAWAKARQELMPGAWFVSLEFAVPDATPVAVLQGDLHGAVRRPLWIYQPNPVAQPGGAAVQQLSTAIPADVAAVMSAAMSAAMSPSISPGISPGISPVISSVKRAPRRSTAGRRGR